MAVSCLSPSAGIMLNLLFDMYFTLAKIIVELPIGS